MPGMTGRSRAACSALTLFRAHLHTDCAASPDGLPRAIRPAFY